MREGKVVRYDQLRWFFFGLKRRSRPGTIQNWTRRWLLTCDIERLIVRGKIGIQMIRLIERFHHQIRFKVRLYTEANQSGMMEFEP